MWIVLHSIFWDGNAVTEQDVLDSLKSPGVRIDLEGNLTDTEDPSRSSNTIIGVHSTIYPVNQHTKHVYQDRRVPLKKKGHIPHNRIRKAQDRISVDSVDTLVNVSSLSLSLDRYLMINQEMFMECLHYFQSLENEVSLEKFWNFFADPDTSVRNLFLNIGFSSFAHLILILPTYFGTRDFPAIKSDFPLIPAGDENEPLRIWNRLLCPQCVLTTVAANTATVRIKK